METTKITFTSQDLLMKGACKRGYESFRAKFGDDPVDLIALLDYLNQKTILELKNEDFEKMDFEWLIAHMLSTFDTLKIFVKVFESYFQEIPDFAMDEINLFFKGEIDYSSLVESIDSLYDEGALEFLSNYEEFVGFFTYDFPSYDNLFSYAEVECGKGFDIVIEYLIKKYGEPNVTYQ